MNGTSITPSPTSISKTGKVNMAIWIPIIPIGILILTLNGILCLAFVAHKQLREKSSNVFICSQAAADGITGILFIPFHTLQRYKLDGDVSSFTTCYIVFLSLFSLFALATDRYLLIVKPIYHRRFIGVEKAKFIVLIVWILPAVLSFIPLIWWYMETTKMVEHQKRFVFSIWLIIVLVTLIMSGMYAYIFWFVKNYIKHKRELIRDGPTNDRQNMKELALLRKELRVTRLFASLLVFFILAYVSIVYINIVILLGRPQLAPIVVIEISLYLFIGNSVANPILCLMMKKDYQKSVMQLIGIQGNRVHPVSTVANSKGQTQAIAAVKLNDVI